MPRPGLAVVVDRAHEVALLCGEELDPNFRVLDYADGPFCSAATYGPISRRESVEIATRLSKGQPPQGPHVPWAVCVQLATGVLKAAASPMFTSGLCYGRGPRGFVLATDPLTCLERTGNTPTLNVEWLRGAASNIPPTHGTPFDSVKRVPPGSVVTWHPMDPKFRMVVPFCGPDTWTEEPSLFGPDAVAAFRDAFDITLSDVVRHTPRASVAMSGGLDSTFLAGSLVNVAPAAYPIDAYVYRPLTHARSRIQRGVLDEGELARSMVAFHRGRIHLHEVRNDAGELPLDAAAAVSQRSGVPALTPTNQVWLTRIRRLARSSGATMWLLGGNGNAAFSGHHSYAARYHWRRRQFAALRRMTENDSGHVQVRRALIQMSRLVGPSASEAPARLGLLARFGLEVADNRPTEPRAAFLHWLARRSFVDVAANPAATEGCLRADPYSSQLVLDLAARIAPAEWRAGDLPRGFARRVSRGRVPDSVRLNTLRGVQGWDGWHVMRHQRQDYLRRIRAILDLPGWDDLDVRRLHDHVSAWPWGNVDGPAHRDVIAVNRLLSVTAFMQANS